MSEESSDVVGSSRHVQSIEVGFRILRVLRAADGPMPLREIAKRSDMPPSKVHLYLVSFVRETVVYQDEQTGYYGLGSFSIQLGLAAIRQHDVVELSNDVIAGLRDRTGCAVYLSLWGDVGPCIVSKADGPLQGAFAVRQGFVLPLMTTATGLVFLAHLPPQQVERAIAAEASYRGTRGTGKRERDKLLNQVREQGYASTVGMLHRNFSGVSKPIFDYNSEIAASLTLLGPAQYMDGDKLEELLAALGDSAAEISQRLGASVSLTQGAAV